MTAKKQDRSNWTSIMISKVALAQLREQCKKNESYESYLRRRGIIR